MLPARNGFESRQLLRGKRNDRDILHPDLVALKRLHEFSLDLRALVPIHAHIWRKDLHFVAATAPGAIHGDFGILHKLRMISHIIVVNSDTDRSSQHKFLAGNLDLGPQTAPDTLSKSRQVLRTLLGRQKHQELGTSQARKRIVRTEMPLQTSREGQNKAVTHIVTISSVCVSKLIDANANEMRPNARIRLGPARKYAKPVEQDFFVGKLGDVAVNGVMHEALVRAALLRHIANKPDATNRPRIVARNARCLDLEPAIAVIRVANAKIGMQPPVGTFLRRPENSLEFLAVGRMQIMRKLVGFKRELTQ